VWAYDGRTAGQVTVNSAVPFTLSLTKGNLVGARLDAWAASAGRFAG
jgi:hypothetical protein